MNRYFTTLGVLCFALTTSRGFSADGIKWESDLQTARKIAVKEQKLLLIHFWTPDCAPCKVVESQVFPRESVVQAIQENYVPLKVNAYENAELRLHFGVDGWPTDVLATVNGEVVHRMVTPQDPRKYVTQLMAVAMTQQPQSNGQQASQQMGLAQASGRTESRWQDGPGAVDVANGALLGDRQSDPSTNSRFGQFDAVEAEAAQNATDQASRFQSTQYQSANLPLGQNEALQQSGFQPSKWQPYGPNVASSDAASAAYNAPTTASNQVPSDRDGRAGTSTKQQEIQNRYVDQPQAVHSQSAQNVTPARAPNPEIGLDGRCPVTLTQQQVWKQGDPRWGAIHRGRTYLFAGPEEQRLFLANPDAYSPVLAGMDLVRLREEGTVVEGDRKFGVLYDDDGDGPQTSRIYLFDCAETRDRFEASPAEFLQPVLQAIRDGALHTMVR